MTIFAFSGCFIFLFLKQFPSSSTKIINDFDIDQNNKNGVSYLSTIKLWISKPFWISLFIAIYCGLTLTFEFGIFPTLITNNSHKFYCMAFFGFIDMLCSKIFGVLSDKIGRLPILLISFVAFTMIYIYL